jgi:biotin synthase
LTGRAWPPTFLAMLTKTRSSKLPVTSDTASDGLRHDWTKKEIEALLSLPFNDLLFKAATVHREHFDPNEVQKSELLSIKTGGCAEDCAYCPQSARYQTEVEVEKLMTVDVVMERAKAAKEGGASRYCLGAAWRQPSDRQLDEVCQMVEGIKGLGMEACVTLGMLTDAQAKRLKAAGLDYYNHNIDTDPEHYAEIITTRTYEDRLKTLDHVREAGLNVCCGGIVGMGESRKTRAGLICALANQEKHPESVPINLLVQVEGTPLHGVDALDPFEMVRTIAVARITMPKSMVRLSAGREQMHDEMQALCFFAGANSIFCGSKLLTTSNPGEDKDEALFARLGLRPMQAPSSATAPRPDGAQ